jgi:hypothetical protein
VPSATLYAFRDLDLLLKLDAEGDEEGWVETAHIARALGFGDDLGGIAQRMGWMRRFGMLERDDKTGLWRITPGAERVISARLRAATERELQALPQEAMIEVMAAVTKRYYNGNAMMATMLRREFLFGTQPR